MQTMTLKSQKVKTYTFREFIQEISRDEGGPYGGAPWSGVFEGKNFTHENDSMYLIGSPAVSFRSGDILCVTEGGSMFTIPGGISRIDLFED